jgi:hypothetical protein
VDTLQFQKAEFAGDGPQCLGCRTPIAVEYFQLAGQTICPVCAAQVRAAQQPPSKQALMRGLLYGVGAALACSALYAAVIMITGLELALIAILVGWLVGKAVRAGCNGLGGRRCQILAVALTYFSITFSYVPVAIQQIRKTAQVNQGQKSETAKDGPTQAGPAPSLGGLVVGIGYLTAIMMAAPFLNLSSGLGGILGIIIIGVGLQRAWRLTAGDPRPLTGPYQREGAAPVA